MSPRRSAPKADYEVGYGKPPLATRFRKGKSGNASGRPRRSRSVGSILAEILERKVTIRDGTGPRLVTVQEAMLLKFTKNALKGDARALNAVLGLAERYRDDPARTIEPAELSADDQVLIRDYLARQAGPNGDDESSS